MELHKQVVSFTFCARMLFITCTTVNERCLFIVYASSLACSPLPYLLSQQGTKMIHPVITILIC
uniref:Uncharacterized protein n=1 Tax=Rhizophora mucronata TaxID=61149 RepID=A0A2P2PZF3_RHIMU